MSDIRKFFNSASAEKRKASTSSKIEQVKKKAVKGNSTKKNSSSNISKRSKSKDKREQRKKKRQISSDSDEDEEPLPSKLRKSKVNCKNENKKKISAENQGDEDEDDEVVVTFKTPSKKIGQLESTKGKKKPVRRSPRKQVLKPTTADDFFSTSTSKPTASSNKRKKPDAELCEDIQYVETVETAKHDAEEDPPSKKVKKDSDKHNVTVESPKKEEKFHKKSPVKGIRKSPRKKSSQSMPNNDFDDCDIIEPTPPPSKKVNQSSSLASKLSAKANSSSETKKENNNNETPESKMKDAVRDYINQAKGAEESFTTSTKALNETKSPQREQVMKSPTIMITPTANKANIHTPASRNTPGSNTQTPGTEQTPVEKRKTNYLSYKNRDGPSALGSIEMPVGAEDCLLGLTFVLTGVLEAFERDDIVDCVKRYGGKVTTSVSGRTNYLIVGRDPGQSKMDKALKHKTHQLSEEEFLELIRTRPGKKGTSPKVDAPKGVVKKLNIQSTLEHKTLESNDKKQDSPMVIDDSQSSNNSESISEFSQSQVSQNTPKSFVSTNSQKNVFSSPASQNTQSPVPSSQHTQSPAPSSQHTPGDLNSLLWVDKYKPKGMKNIVGQQGDKSNANKLRKWLLRWKENNAPGKKGKPNFYSGKEDGSIFKAALLSGPPGVGKTTTATLVCQNAGFSFIEMNASDTRGKKALETVIKESLSNVTVNGMLQGSNNDGKNHALIMDEVDGMAGNEDRGGMQELIQLIKKSRIPIICMCNDRNSTKVRSLANHCFDLRFYKPRVEQIKGFALSIAVREGLKIPPQAMEQIVIGANQDIRQVVHNLQMWTSTSNKMSYDDAKAEANNAKKNIKLGPFDIVKTLYTYNEASKMSIKDKTDLFFMDYSFIPLFMQENYLNVNPAEGRGNDRKTLEAMSSTADAIADSDLVDRLIRSKQVWSMLPLQGLFSTVIPSMKMAGYLGQRIEFPQWLGKNSSRGKHDRILQELKTHMALSCNCMKTDINLDYISTLKHRLKQPLLEKDADANVAAKQVIDMMDQYNLTREDWDSVMEIGKWGNEKDDSSKIPTKVKTAFTRLYNKEVHKTPYAVHQVAKKTKINSSDDILPAEDDDQVGDDADDHDEDDISKDAMIKVKKEVVASTSGKRKSKTTAKTKPAKKKK